MKKILIAAAMLTLADSMYAKSDTEKIGDILSATIPIAAYGTTLYLDDEEGQYQFYKSYGTTLAVTFALKYTVQEKRPDSDDTDSFPSGHTSSAFSGATFIYKRYGFKYAAIPYLCAIYTGYSRVYSDRHFTHDVIAGALIGTASSWFFTIPYKNLNITPEVGAGYKGLQFNYKW